MRGAVVAAPRRALPRVVRLPRAASDAAGRDGCRAVLQFPDRESEHEGAALARWDGDGAIRLLARDDARRALLIERCEPGEPLSGATPDTALTVFADLLPRLWKPTAGPFHSLQDEAARWADGLPATWERAGRPFERRLLDAALDALSILGSRQSEQVLLHQDLHAGNVLRAGRERGSPSTRSRWSASGSARGWTIGQSLAWGFENGRALPVHVEVTRWLVDSR